MLSEKLELTPEITLEKAVDMVRLYELVTRAPLAYTSEGDCQVNPFPNKPWFLRVCNTSVLKTQWEKEKLLVTSNFSFSHGVFYPFGELSAIFIKYEIVICKLFQFERF